VISKSIVNDVPAEHDGVLDGFTTRITPVPGFETKLAGTAALNDVALLKVVASAVPFHWTDDWAQKFAPATKRLNPAPPALTVDGFRANIDGPPGSMPKLTMFEVPAEQPVMVGFTTRIAADPAAAIRPAGTAAFNTVALVKVVASALAFHCTVDWAQKLAPETDRLNAGPPAVAFCGDKAMIEGGGLTAKLTASELSAWQPVTFGFTTRIETDPATAMRLAGTAALKDVAL
jgi:hypothetical protein